MDIFRSKADETPGLTTQISMELYDATAQRSQDHRVEEPSLRLVTTEVAQDADPSLRLTVNTSRVLLSTTVLMAALAVLTVLMIDGFTFTTLDSTQLDEDKKGKLLDKYNTYSGSLASIVSMPFQPFVAMLLPVFFLCFTTKAVMSANKSFVELWGPTMAVVGVAWVVNQGMNALNVQFDPPQVEFIIGANDLASSDASQFWIAVTNITDTTNLAGIAATDTILRSATTPSSSTASTSCLGDGGGLPDSVEASVRFGFPLNYWLYDFVSESVASTKTLSISMSEDFSSREISEVDLPNGSTNKTAVLFTYAFWTVCQHFGCGSFNTQPVYDSVYSTSASDLVMNIQETLTNTTQELESPGISSSDSTWLNISMPEVSIVFSTFDLSPQITFESVTFDLPVKNETMKYLLGITTNDTDWTTDLSTSDVCNDYACILKTPIQSDLSQDQVRLLRLCMNQENTVDEDDEDLTAFQVPSTMTDEHSCRFPSNSSALVYSFSQHLSVDEVNINVSDSSQVIYLKNPRRTYRVTVGRLTWTTVDLAEQYGAVCSYEGGCEGLYFPLTSETQHIIVGGSFLPTPNTIVYPTSYTNWQVLAIAETRISETEQGDLIYPPIYPFATGSLPWTELSGQNCSYRGSDFLNGVMQRHIYSKDPLQPAYTAGLFWLFQNAALKDIQSKTATGGIRLSFGSNREWISPRVSIPKTSAIITLVGCGVVIVIGLLVTYWSGNAQRHSSLSTHLSAQNVAGIHVNTNQFPPLLVHTKVQLNGDDKYRSAGTTHIHDFKIAEVTLRHRTNDTVGDFKIGRKQSQE